MNYYLFSPIYPTSITHHCIPNLSKTYSHIANKENQYKPNPNSTHPNPYVSRNFSLPKKIIKNHETSISKGVVQLNFATANQPVNQVKNQPLRDQTMIYNNCYYQQNLFSTNYEDARLLTTNRAQLGQQTGRKTLINKIPEVLDEEGAANCVVMCDGRIISNENVSSFGEIADEAKQHISVCDFHEIFIEMQPGNKAHNFFADIPDGSKIPIPNFA